jgi:hypothetical protein
MQWVLGGFALIAFGVVLRRLLRLDSGPRRSASGLSRIGASREALYQPVARELETQSAIIGISLNEAFEERDSGHTDIAWRLVRLSVSEWSRLTEVTTTLLNLLAKYMPTVQMAVPVRNLSSHRFKSQIMVDQVRMHELLHQLVFRSKLRFQLHVRILRRSLESLTEDFLHQYRTAERDEQHPVELWTALDFEFHDFDLLTKETLLAFRAFLVCMQDSDLEGFSTELAEVLPRGVRSASGAVAVER